MDLVDLEAEVCPGEEGRVKLMVTPVLTPCLCPTGSMYDGLADNYNNYGTTSRSSYFSKFQAGNGSWGYPVRSSFPSESPGMFVGWVSGLQCRKPTPVSTKSGAGFGARTEAQGLGRRLLLGHHFTGWGCSYGLAFGLMGYF